MDNTDFFEFEERSYLNPTVSRDSQLDFIDTLRNTMADKQNQVNASTYALGSQLPSNLGGLGGGEQTFEARYRTPQLEQTAADLRKAAQASALNAALSNLQNAWKKRYNDAVLDYQKRSAADSGGNSGGNGASSGLPINTNTGTYQNLGVRQPAQTNEQQQLNTSQLNAQNHVNRNNLQGTLGGGTTFTYKQDGQTMYGTIYRDRLGNIIGVETPNGSYNGSYGQNFLRQLGDSNNLFSVAGEPVTSLSAIGGF